MFNQEDYFKMAVAVSFTRAYWDDISRNHPDEARRSLGRIKIIVLDDVEKKIQAAMFALTNTPTA